MPSSTSSSERPLPADGRPLTGSLLLGVLLGALLFGGWEMFWRSRGFRPSVEAIEASWWRTLDQLEPDSTVLLGTSRILGAVDPAQLAEQRGIPKVLQLALLGSNPTPLIEGLAEREQFHGTLIVEALPMHFFDASGESAVEAAELWRGYSAWSASPARRWESWFDAELLPSVVTRHARLSLREQLNDVRRTRLAAPGIVIHRRDRFTEQDFRSMPPRAGWTPQGGYPNLPLRGARTRGRPANPEELSAQLQRVESAVLKLQARGASVLFLRLPACGERAVIEEERFPRATYWDALAASTSAMALHLGDDPRFTGFDCFDGSHVDVLDAPAFTRALAQLLDEQLGPR